MEISDLVNLLINGSTSVVIIAYFIYRDWKWNEKLISTLTKIETALEDMKGVTQDENKRKRA